MDETPASRPAGGVEDVDLRELLTVERIEQDLFRSTTVVREEHALYGGQVAAQALMSAGATVDPARRPHSLHGYFLRPGDPLLPIVFTVYRDRDGRSFSARRVVAIQHGKVIFNMAASFHVGRSTSSAQAEPMPDVAPPEACNSYVLSRLCSFECRVPLQPHPGTVWPTRFWARAAVPLLDDPLLHAGVLTYLSDISTGVLPSRGGSERPGASVDHAVWFHDRADLTYWVLSDYQPRFVGSGRGCYSGSVFTRDGRLVASIAQEALYGSPGSSPG
ncbi:acyl-CoA thioesterase [uncultured Jatrophihabitans sp.]|uniref:acyl-CoA thioesterase n=1 Tax=uncultured Jatrophihabitans sp. TaxID=1610747 RepID=UPI0035CC0D30